MRFLNKKERITSWETGMNTILAAAISQDSTAFPMPKDAPSRLWLRLHWRKEPPDITHLILDQFEEVFTLGTLARS